MVVIVSMYAGSKDPANIKQALWSTLMMTPSSELQYIWAKRLESLVTRLNSSLTCGTLAESGLGEMGAVVQ